MRGVIQQGRERPVGRKNPKKPEVSWHTTLLAKSRVLYLLRTLTLERGGCASCQRFLASAEQEECGYPRSSCSYGGGAENLRRRVRKRDIYPAAATFPLRDEKINHSDQQILDFKKQRMPDSEFLSDIFL